MIDIDSLIIDALLLKCYFLLWPVMFAGESSTELLNERFVRVKSGE